MQQHMAEQALNCVLIFICTHTSMRTQMRTKAKHPLLLLLLLDHRSNTCYESKTYSRTGSMVQKRKSRRELSADTTKLLGCGSQLHVQENFLAAAFLVDSLPRGSRSHLSMAIAPLSTNWKKTTGRTGWGGCTLCGAGSMQSAPKAWRGYCNTKHIANSGSVGCIALPACSAALAACSAPVE